MEGLTYDFVAEHMASEYEARKIDKVCSPTVLTCFFCTSSMLVRAKSWWETAPLLASLTLCCCCLPCVRCARKQCVRSTRKQLQ
jgi:hypothetical protein